MSLTYKCYPKLACVGTVLAAYVQAPVDEDLGGPQMDVQGRIEHERAAHLDVDTSHLQCWLII